MFILRYINIVLLLLFVQTDMTADLPDNHFGGKKVTTVEGADTPVFLALLPSGVKEPNGQFLLQRKVYDFINTDVSIQISSRTTTVN